MRLSYSEQLLCRAVSNLPQAARSVQCERLGRNLMSSFMLCSHLTSAFASTSTSPSKFNIASMVKQMQRMGLNPFSSMFALLFTQCLTVT